MFRFLVIFATLILSSCSEGSTPTGDSATSENRGQAVSRDQEVDCGQYDYEVISSTSNLTVTQTVTPDIVDIAPLVFKCVNFEHTGLRKKGDINVTLHNGFFDSKERRTLDFYLDHPEFTAAGSEYQVAEMSPQAFTASYNRGEFPAVSLDYPRIFGSSNSRHYSGNIKVGELNYEGNSSITFDIVHTAVFGRATLNGSRQDLAEPVTVKTHIKGTVEFKGRIKGPTD